MKKMIAVRFSLCLCFSVVLLFLKAALAQQSNFRNPLDLPIQLSANFGELRTDHYHTGWDIRTNGKTGYAVHAAADGYVSRIKVSPFGFGNVLYITHPNGYMTVYGHLDRFNDAIAKYVKQQQYAKQSFEVELFPDASKFSVKEGDLIAYSGNSGSSEGPHLHFEIRDAGGQSYPLNPKQFLPITDMEPPQFSALYVYDLSGGRNASQEMRYAVTKRDSIYHVINKTTAAGKSKLAAQFDTLLLASAAFGLAVDARDLLNSATNGIYQLECVLDGSVIYSLRMDRLDFANGRYVNAHLDYAAWRNSKTAVQKLFVMPGDKNTIYSPLVNRGLIALKDTLFHQIRIKATDDNGNTSSLQFVVKRISNAVQKEAVASSPNHFAFDRANTFNSDSIKLSLPAGVLYEDVDFVYSMDNAAAQKSFSAIHHVHNAFTPLHSFCDLSILPRKIPETLKSKAVIVYRNENGRISSKTTRWDGNFLATRIRDFGDYFVMLDTAKPKITTAIAQNQLITSNHISFTVSDNLSGITQYNAFTDNQWTLTEYDAKNNRMQCEIGDSLPIGNHELKLIVKDEVNNEATFILLFRK